MASQNLFFISNVGIISTCDVKPKTFPHFTYDRSEFETIKKGDVVWISCCYLNQFVQEVLPSVEEPFILVTSCGDESFPSSYAFDIDAFLHHEKLFHFFVQNCEINHPKISHLPIGIDFFSGSWNGRYMKNKKPLSIEEQENDLQTLLSTLKPTHERICKAYVDFHLNDTLFNGFMQRHKLLGETRRDIFYKLLPSKTMDYGSRKVLRHMLWEKKGNYAFSISPPGNGLDCYRTWEDLTLGCIVIVKTSPLNPLYEGLPVVIVKDWDEITQSNMAKWLLQYGDAFTNPSYREKLTNTYWINKIQTQAKLCKSS